MHIWSSDCATYVVSVDWQEQSHSVVNNNIFAEFSNKARDIQQDDFHLPLVVLYFPHRWDQAQRKSPGRSR